MKHSKSPPTKNNGFSLMEMIVVVGIMGMVATIILTNIPGVTTSVRVNSAASTIMSTIKEVRHKSTSVKEFKSSLFPSYGVYFDMNEPQKIVVYADCIIDDNNDGIINDNDTFIYIPTALDCNGESGFVEEIFLGSHVRINEIRSISEGSTVVETRMYLEYVRPEPSVWISESNGIILPVGKMELDLTDTAGRITKTISFWSTGQISIR